jgi:hypothetical protein
MKPDMNSVERVHPQLSHNRNPLNGVLVGVGSLWPVGASINPQVITLVLLLKKTLVGIGS